MWSQRMQDDWVGTRVFPRIEYFDSVTVQDLKNNVSQQLFASNLSLGGVFLRSNKPLPQGMKVGLRFRTPQETIEVEESIVVWSKPFEPISIDGRLAGMGIRFERISDSARVGLEHFISQTSAQVPAGESKQPAALPTPVPTRAKRELIESLLDEIANSDIEFPTPAAPLPEPKLDLREQHQCQLQKRPKIDLPPHVLSRIQKTNKSAASKNFLEGAPEVVTFPPHPRTRIMLFGMFVMVVAVVTFFSLLFLMPLDEPLVHSRVVSTAGPLSTDQVSSKTLVPVAPKEVPKPEPKAKTVAIDKKASPPLEAKEPAPVRVEPKEPASDSVQALADSAFSKTVGPPQFITQADSFRLIIPFTGKTKIRHFPLKDPPRLVLDFYDTDFLGTEHTFLAPFGFVEQIRVGIQAQYTRFVVDFKNERTRPYSISQREDKVIVIFSK